LPTSRKGFTRGAGPPKLPRYLVVRLKKGWHFEADSGRFVAARKSIDARSLLPKGAEVRPHIPQPAGAPGERASAAEKELARFVQVVLPRNADLRVAQRRIEELEAVQDVHVSPEVELP